MLNKAEKCKDGLLMKYDLLRSKIEEMLHRDFYNISKFLLRTFSKRHRKSRNAIR